MKKMMKLKIISRAVLVLTLILVSCDDFLEEEPPIFISSENFYKTESDARTGADGIYQTLQDGSQNSIYGRWWVATDLGTDDVTAKTGRQNFNDWFTHTINPEHTWLQSWNQYQGFWKGIARANDIITFLPDADIDETIKASIIGEARAMRALCYLHLVKSWGDMPLITKAVEELADFNLPRSSVDAVYDQIIIPDLKFAEENCVDQLHTGRVTKWTAKVILADVYLTRAGWRRTSQGEFVQGDASNWGLARDKAKEILDSSPHSLITEPFIDGAHTTAACAVPWLEASPYSIESMFELGSINLVTFGSFLTRDCNPNSTGANYWGSNNSRPFEDQGITATVRDLDYPGSVPNVGHAIPTPDLALHYEAGDERREAFLMTSHTIPDGTTYIGQPVFRKYVDIDFFLGKENTSFLNTNRNFILYRYADALLIYAEAQNEADGSPNADGYNAVNEIRNRAGLADLSSGLSQNDFRIAVWGERRSEFCGEMKRRFDLIRTNRLKTETENIQIVWTAETGSVNEYTQANILFGTTSWPDHEWLFPIPQTEMSLNRNNNWVQNAGYPDVAQ